MSISTSDRQTLNAAIEIIERETDASGDSLILRGFGTFKRSTKAAKTARNPRTGAPVAVPARTVLSFSASKQTRRDI
jgi:DNA-binding protein HU-beta